MKVEDGVAVYLAVSSDPEKTIANWDPIPATSTDDLIQVTVGRADDPTTSGTNEAINTSFSVGNAPAYELPSAGSIGTFLFTYLGFLFSAIAAGLYLLRKRRLAAL